MRTREPNDQADDGDNPAPARVPVGRADPARERILVVEDHAASRAALRLLLAGRGYAVKAVGSAREAETAAQQEHFELLVSDIGLPDATGYELLARLRAMQPDIVAVAVSAQDPDPGEGAFGADGFQAYRVKPIDFREFTALVRQLVRREAGPAPVEYPSPEAA